MHFGCRILTCTQSVSGQCAIEGSAHTTNATNPASIRLLAWKHARVQVVLQDATGDTPETVPDEVNRMLRGEVACTEKYHTYEEMRRWIEKVSTCASHSGYAPAQDSP